MVSPYVEISYENTIMRTSSGSGANPVWNEELTIPFQYVFDSYTGVWLYWPVRSL